MKNEIKEKYFYDVLIISLKINEPLTYYTYSDSFLFHYVKVKVHNNLVNGILYKKREKKDIKIDINLILGVEEIETYYLPPAYLETAIFIKNYYFLSFNETLRFFKPHKNQKIENNQKIEKFNVELSKKQTEAYNKILSYQNSDNRTLVLFGETGSGKTRVYKKLIADVLENNQTVLFLVPEINLVPQTLKRLSHIFGTEIIGVWHSKILKTDKSNTLEAIYNNRIKIVIGTLSSLFLPLKNISLIIVDEEHSESYAMGIEEKTQFSGRDMAIYLGEKLKIRTILGSATPLLNSFVKFPIIKLERDISNSTNSFTYISDQKQFIEFAIKKSIEKIELGERVLWYVPIRGNFKYISCKNCKTRINCINCSTGVSVYLDEDKIQCNRCGFADEIPTICPTCGGDLKVSKAGTVEITKFLTKLLPEYNINYLDGDKTKKKGELDNILTSFRNNEIDILVGTNMISKGHDFPNLTLVVIFGIDNYLDYLDFQSYETSLRTIVQIAGRSGRAKDGEVIINTRHSAFFKKFINKYEDFITYELEMRKDLFPPFINFGRVVISNTSKELTYDIFNHIELYFILFAPFKIFISGETPIKKISTKYRYQIIVKSKSIKELLIYFKETFSLLPKNMLKSLYFEINPVHYS
jgi:primosomal protein N' (replication factor Y)